MRSPLLNYAIKNKEVIAGISIVMFFLILCLISFIYLPYSPIASTGPSFAPPSLKHLFGTTNIGQDVFSQWVYGTRSTLLVGFLTAALSTAIGLTVGVTSGFIRSLNEPLMRLVDIVMTLPALPLLIVIAAFVKPSIFIVAFIIALLGWAGMARVIRSNILSIKESSFVEVALMSGVPKHKIMFVDLLKHVLPLVLAYSLFAVIGAILTEASLDFIGVGPVTDYSWGAMIAYAQENGAIFVKAWWWFLPPGISIAILSTGFGLIAYGMESFYNKIT